MILKGRTRNDVVFWFAREHGKHPNMVDAVLAAADYDSPAVGSDSAQESLYSIESV